MLLTFIHPEYLWLLVLIPPVLALALLAPRRLSRMQRWASLVLRAFMLASLILALAGTQVSRAIGATTTIFLLDGSDSVSLTQRASAEAFIQQALDAMPPDDKAGVVVFGRDALVERSPSNDTVLGQITVHPDSGATSLETALQLGLAVEPNEGHQRLVVLSDGGENMGDAQAAAQLAANRGIPIDIVPLNGRADGPDAQITSMSLPASAREGQDLTLRIGVESTASVQGRLIVTGPNNVLVSNQQIDIPTKSVVYELRLPTPPAAFNRYLARIEVANDARPENNAAEAYTLVQGQPRVLLIEGTPDSAKNLATALGAANINAETVAPANAPETIVGLSNYDVVILVDVPKRAISERTQSALAAFVHDLGRGLLMVGGTQAFGPGGWRDTPIETALPVTMDIPTTYRIPPVSIVVLVDTSGSMSEEVGGKTKLQLAADGAARIAALMRDEDEITLVPYGDSLGTVVGPIPGTRRDEAIRKLGTIPPGGGGIMFTDGLLAAEKAISTSKLPVRHIITLTDGNDTEQQEGAIEVIQRLRTNKVTLTSIAVGEGSDTAFLQQAVDKGGGRYFLTRNGSEIPSILTDEAQAVLQSYIVEETFTPTQTALHPILSDITSVPALDGRVVTSAKQSAQVLLATPRGEPVLAAWQYGLGRTAAWTSDMRGQWASKWVSWDTYPRFAAQLITWLLPTPDSSLLTLVPETQNGQLVLVAQAQDTQGRPRSGLQVQGQLLRGDGTALTVELREVSAGEYRAAVVGAVPGAYLSQIVANDGQGNIAGVATGGVVVPRSAEYRAQGANPGLLSLIAQISGGRETITPKQAFDPNLASRGQISDIALPLLLLALILLPLDIAVRRVFMLRPRTLLRRPASEPLPVAPAVAIPQPAATTSKATAAPTRKTAKEEQLERLRVAQEEARKRARGED